MLTAEIWTAAGPKTIWASDLISVKFFTLAPVLVLPGSISTGNVQWIYFLDPVWQWECLFQWLQTLEVSLQNLGTVLSCDIAILSLFLMVLLLVPLVWHCWFCPIISRAFPRKSCNSPKGKWAMLWGFSLCIIPRTAWFPQWWFMRVWVVVPKARLFYRGFAAHLQWHSCNNTLCGRGGAVGSTYI